MGANPPTSAWRGRMWTMEIQRMVKRIVWWVEVGGAESPGRSSRRYRPELFQGQGLVESL